METIKKEEAAAERKVWGMMFCLLASVFIIYTYGIIPALTSLRNIYNRDFISDSIIILSQWTILLAIVANAVRKAMVLYKKALGY